MLSGEIFYISPSIKRPWKVIDKVNHGKPDLSHFLIVLAKEPEQLEILPTYLFLQKCYQNTDYRVVGICDSYQNAIETVLQMTNDCLEKTGEALLKPYLASLSNGGLA